MKTAGGAQNLRCLRRWRQVPYLRRRLSNCNATNSALQGTVHAQACQKQFTLSNWVVKNEEYLSRRLCSRAGRPDARIRHIGTSVCSSRYLTEHND